MDGPENIVTPNVYIIAGPNGAGKTTFAREFLPLYADCKNFINADMIAQGVSPFSPELAFIWAGRMVLAEIDRLGTRRSDFGSETTLSGVSHLNSIRCLRTWGYAVHFFYLWVPDIELTLERVHGRVLRGGHDVPEAIIRRRFARSIGNFLQKYPHLGDSWMLFDNSREKPEIVASMKGNKLSMMEFEKYEDLSALYGEK